MKLQISADSLSSPSLEPRGSSSGSAGAKVALETMAAKTVESLTQPQAGSVAADVNASVRAAAAQIDSYLKSVGRELEFRVDEDTGMTVVTVRETASGDVIRQIPNEEVLQLARSLKSSSAALLDLKV